MFDDTFQLKSSPERWEKSSKIHNFNVANRAQSSCDHFNVKFRRVEVINMLLRDFLRGGAFDGVVCFVVVCWISQLFLRSMFVCHTLKRRLIMIAFRTNGPMMSHGSIVVANLCPWARCELLLTIRCAVSIRVRSHDRPFENQILDVKIQICQVDVFVNVLNWFWYEWK